MGPRRLRLLLLLLLLLRCWFRIAGRLSWQHMKAGAHARSAGGVACCWRRCSCHLLQGLQYHQGMHFSHEGGKINKRLEKGPLDEAYKVWL